MRTKKAKAVGIDVAVVADSSRKAQKAKSANVNVKYTRDELNLLNLQYWLIRDCIDGEPAIKGLIGNSSIYAANFNGGGGTPDVVASVYSRAALTRAQRYLPMPNPDDQSQQNWDRYRAYVQRAVFYNVTSRTLDGMVGQIFLIPPAVTVPTELNALTLDADGQGLNMTQFCKRAVRYVAAFGRGGLFVDYPRRDVPTTKAEIANGDVKPVMKVYPPWDIINWRTMKRGVETVLNLVVIRERADDIGDDGFQVSPYERYIVLRINDQDQYTMQVYNYEGYDNDGRNGTFDAENEFTPLDSTGKPMNTIPFTFLGAENNDPAVDKPPMFDIAALNIGHYHNSADYEEACFLCGQPTVVASGLDETWVKDVLKGVLTMGSRAGIPLPVGAKAELLQAKENSMPLEAMKLKEDQMVSIGAKLVIQKRVQRTATEAIVDSSSESSVLTNVAHNVGDGITFGLKIAARFAGADPNKCSCKLNDSFELNRMTMDDVAKLVASWQQGAISFTEMRDGVRKSGIANQDDKTARAEIEKDIQAGFIAGPVADPATNDPNPTNNPEGHANNDKNKGRM